MLLYPFLIPKRAPSKWTRPTLTAVGHRKGPASLVLAHQQQRYSSTIGIDLGTSTTVTAVLEADKPRVVENIEGDRTTPSVVAIIDGAPLIGRTAKRQALLNPKNTFYAVKRLLGIRYDQLPPDLKLNYEITPTEDGFIDLKDETGKRYSPRLISTYILAKMKENAESALGYSATAAVIGVPTYFSALQRKETKEAAKDAGLDATLINEPTAAALAYGLNDSKNQTLLIYDLGGSTFDFSIVKTKGNTFEVVASGGDLNLGGINIDDLVYDYLMDEFKRKNNIDLRSDSNAVQKIRDTAERVKMELSTSMTSDVQLPYIAANQTGPLHMEEKVSRAQLERMALPLLTKTIEISKKVLTDAKMEMNQINAVIACGGQSRMPKVLEILKDAFGKEPVKGINSDELVAVGAVLSSNISVDASKVAEVILLDVTPLNLGVEVFGGLMETIIPANTPLPVQGSCIFAPATDNQKELEIKVVQGNRPFCSDNVLIGKVTFDELPPCLKGEPLIKITLTITTEGIVMLKVENLITHKKLRSELSALYTKLDEIKGQIWSAEDNQLDDLDKFNIVSNNKRIHEGLSESFRILSTMKEHVSEADYDEVGKALSESTTSVETAMLKDLSSFKEETNARIAKVVNLALKKSMGEDL